MVKAHLKVTKAKRARKLVKDKAIVNFLLEHMKPAKINFSKIKIPSFLNLLENEGKKITNSNDFPNTKVLDEKPISGISLFNKCIKNEKNLFVIESKTLY